jgi:hypothetical protein
VERGLGTGVRRGGSDSRNPALGSPVRFARGRWVSAAACVPFAAVEICERVADGATVVGAFPTTVAALRTGDAWRGDDYPAVLCYIDRNFPKPPPMGKPFDRGILGVVDGKARVYILGYRDQLQVYPPLSPPEPEFDGTCLSPP